MSIEDSMYNIPLLANEYNYPYSAVIDEDENYDPSNNVDKENNIEPLEIEYEVNNFYGSPFGNNDDTLEMGFKDKMLCLFTVCSFCFPMNLIFLFIYKYG